MDSRTALLFMNIVFALLDGQAILQRMRLVCGDVCAVPALHTPPEDFSAFHQAWRARQVTLREAADACGMPKSTFYDAALRAGAAVRRI